MKKLALVFSLFLASTLVPTESKADGFYPYEYEETYDVILDVQIGNFMGDLKSNGIVELRSMDEVGSKYLFIPIKSGKGRAIANENGKSMRDLFPIKAFEAQYRWKFYEDKGGAYKIHEGEVTIHAQSDHQAVNADIILTSSPFDDHGYEGKNSGGSGLGQPLRRR